MIRLAFLIILIALLSCGVNESDHKIDRKAVINRHNVINHSADTLASLTLGNGSFAYTVDVTGLQSFPVAYQNGVALGTQSEWGWHSLPNNDSLAFSETLDTFHFGNRDIPYPVQRKANQRSKAAVEYYRSNPHRLQLGNFGIEILKKDGSTANLSDLTNINQELNLWTGEIISRFSVEDENVTIKTVVDSSRDIIAVHIESELLEKARINLFLKFPYPSMSFKDVATHYSGTADHSSIIRENDHALMIEHALDSTRYYVSLHTEKKIIAEKADSCSFRFTPDRSSRFSATLEFSVDSTFLPVPDFATVEKHAAAAWAQYWSSGAAVDFSGSTDPRATELERRVVLSQYLLRAQEASSFPPQETGLTYNSWYGRPHLEMHWWHSVQYALWGRPELLEKSMDWYFHIEDKARAIAKRQGFKGLRWPKMTDPDGGEAPSSVGSFLIWQQPHLIYMSELLYKYADSSRILTKFARLVEETAAFMADFPTRDSSGTLHLGPGIIPAQECFNPATTFDPTYELAYWRWALETAQQWRLRSGKPRNGKWDQVLDQLAPLPEKNGVYLATASTPDCYAGSKYTIDHPAVLASFASLPATKGMDTTTMNQTLDTIQKVWDWEHTWGWDFPLVAMTATRLGRPEDALDALFMDVSKNRWLANGHNYQDNRLTIYLPGNGGLLSAIAMMCAGTRTSAAANPGFPKDGSWNVKWEGFNKIF